MIHLKKLYIEPTSNCNLQCEMCFRHSWFDEQCVDMTFDIFNRILETIPQETKTLFFGGMGEPLNHPGIVDMVKACRVADQRIPSVRIDDSKAFGCRSGQTLGIP